MTNTTLWYRSPAVEWTQALPLGNGRLGGMLHGGVGREEIQLNESTLWSGGPYQPTNAEALPNLAAVRELIFAGRYAEAQALANQHLLAKPHMQMSYQPAGNLFVEFIHEPVPDSYRRELDLTTAIATTSYRLLGTGISDDAATFTRECFISSVDDVLVLRLESSRPGALSFEVWLDSPQPGDIQPGDAATLDYRGTNFDKHGIKGQLRFGIGLDMRLEGGSAERRGRRLVVRGATAAVFVLDIATSFRRFDNVSGDPEALLAARRKAVAGKSYAQLRADHVAAHQAQFERLAIDLGPGRQDLPTDERIARFADGEDPALAALYVQYGRYLMLASSQPGTQPTTLQGIWNKETRPPWGSKYTANINIQMNYWLPDPANLGECVEPLLAMVEDLTITGAEMARQHYGARGWVLHHNTDLWRATGPVDGAQWGLWPSGGAWFCAQLWDHAVYAGRPEALVRRLLPVIAGSVRFFLDTLQPLPGTDLLVTVPSISPENLHPHGAAVCAGPTMDNQILRDLFDAYLAAAEQLGSDDPMQADVRAARARLPEHRIGKQGQLQEWLEDWDMDVPEIHHRHVSHLYGLYPSLQIDPDGTPDLAEAARKSLEIRGDDATGWGIGWRINLWARLRQGSHAHDVLALLLSPSRSYPNLFDAHPPFQIDGNFGGAAGILEMLVQSTAEKVLLLPALPPQWPMGKLRGVRARGGLELDLQWTSRGPTQVRLRSVNQRSIVLECRGATQTVTLAAGETVELVF
ncbi:glycoside hydrolase family 95 protein [Devosia aquimaris]|uniref:glycoside hydrolase family 95 protein n=1 Tax=Devosia aquimaris TaxID=2866214 RepID=UPI001CD0CDFA|nr:glycoside hydrolase family 95 protein [Devosia sp. CJK-A8-3]